MLSNKTGVKLAGSKSQNQGRINESKGNVRKVGVNSPTGNNINKSFVSTTNTQNQGQQRYQAGQGTQGQGQGGFNRANDYDDGYFSGNQKGRVGANNYYDNETRANKSEILDRAWGNKQLAN